jgi:hypothetical protein
MVHAIRSPEASLVMLLGTRKIMEVVQSTTVLFEQDNLTEAHAEILPVALLILHTFIEHLNHLAGICLVSQDIVLN